MGHWLSRLVWLSWRRGGRQPEPGWRATGRILGPHQLKVRENPGNFLELPGWLDELIKWPCPCSLSGLVRIGSPTGQRGRDPGTVEDRCHHRRYTLAL